MNYCLDHDDQVLSHQAEIALELAQSYQRVSVLTGRLGNFLPPGNMAITSVNWDSFGKFRASILVVYNFLRICFLNRPTVVFSHMTENYTLLTGIFSRIFGIKHVLWYAHASSSIRLRIAVMLSNNVVTSTAGSFPFRSRKIISIGQSINQNLFVEKSQQPTEYRNAIHVGRIDPSKNLDLIISCYLANVKQSGELVIVGRPSTYSSSLEWKSVRASSRKTLL